MLNCLASKNRATKNNWGLCMNQKGISTLVIAVIVVVIAVVGVGVYLAMSGTGGTGGNGGATPTPTAPDVGGATSLQFKVEVTSEGTSYTNTYMAKNIGSSNMMIRIEIGDTMVYILNGADQKAWTYMDGTWTDISSTFSTEWNSWNTTVSGYQDSLENWTGTGEYTYTEAGTTIRIFDISVNPTLADSLFQHS
jgi:uncharacterized protein (UPF0333 family)